MRVNPTGIPTRHIPHDTKPINCPSEANGLPESPLHTFAKPPGGNAQSIPLLMMVSVEFPKYPRHTSFVIVVTFANCNCQA